MTEKLYYRNPGQSEFEARVLEAQKEKKGWRVVLDRTCFYPEGGGQPADKGWLNDIPVKDVQKEGDTIYHYLAADPGKGAVKGRIDMAWRLDYMQQHTGQHIISAALWRHGKYTTVSVHMGSDITTIEIDSPDIPQEDLVQVEKVANKAIRDDLPLNYIKTEPQELDKFPLRKPCPLEGEIRLVQIGDFDCVGCGGLHLDTSRKVGLVKAVGVEKIRNHARIAWKIGERAYDDYRKKERVISELRAILATDEERFPAKVRHAQEELATLRRRFSWLENRLAEKIAAELYSDPDNVPTSGCRIIARSWRRESDNLVKKIMKELLNKERVAICLVNVSEDKALWSIGCSEDMQFPFDEIKDELLAVIEGKGGGRHPLWQGSGQKTDKIDAFLATFKTLAARFL